jgi:hypothetical protein
MMPVKLSEVGRTITLRFSPQDIWVGVRWERWSQGCEFRFSAESGHVIPHGYEQHVPGCPDFACWTASIDSVRMQLIDNWSNWALVIGRGELLRSGGDSSHF